jgi:CRISPR system Cascade subunit CasD
LGAGGEQTALLEQFSGLAQTVVSYRREEGTIKSRVRDRRPLLRDFQMVGSGYDMTDPWESQMSPKTQDGKRAVGGGSKLTYRFYLQDAYFAVVLEIPNSLKVAILEGLKLPVWPLFLGRKCCVPSDIIGRGAFDSENDAIAEAASIAKSKGLSEEFRAASTVAGREADEILTVNDVPVSFGESKVYRERQVGIFYAD